MTRLLCLVFLLVSSTALADQGWRRPRPHGRPVLDITRLRALTNACNDAMEGPDNERRCLDLVSRLRMQEAAVRDTIRGCEDAMEGDDNELSCIATMTSARIDLGAVRACEDAMEGDANELRCMASLAGTRYNAVDLVRYCEDNETGDDAELSCIARWR
ncbi:MAG TPA: hypothetical protein VIV11_18020 [Kofleriaceae bacterium]